MTALMWLLSVAALVMAASALLVALRVQRELAGKGKTTEDLPDDARGLRREVARLSEAVDGSLRHLAVVRYDAFADAGGRLSWSLALADLAGNGMVLTSIHGRTDARTYAKNLAGWKSDQPLSPEEAEAVESARRR